MNWKHFAAASFIVLAALVRNDIPLVPVLAGVCGVGLIGLWRLRRAG